MNLSTRLDSGDLKLADVLARSTPKKHKVKTKTSQSSKAKPKYKSVKRVTWKADLNEYSIEGYQGLRLLLHPSSIKGAGQGLFTMQDIKKGTRIIEYSGKNTKEDPSNQSNYVLQISKNFFIDAEDEKISSAGRYVNDCRSMNREEHTCPGNNCKFVWDARGKKAFIVSKLNIAAGSELFVNYGRTYWSRFQKQQEQ